MDRGAWCATVHGVAVLDMTEWLTHRTKDNHFHQNPKIPSCNFFAVRPSLTPNSGDHWSVPYYYRFAFSRMWCLHSNDPGLERGVQMVSGVSGTTTCQEREPSDSLPHQGRLAPVIQGGYRPWIKEAAGLDVSYMVLHTYHVRGSQPSWEFFLIEEVLLF